MQRMWDAFALVRTCARNTTVYGTAYFTDKIFMAS